jgi:NAD(P)-dependent dehydrogenase (short-subunit alcohol dehydrogenase family)
VTTLQGKNLFISGTSCDIGLAIALRAARDGTNITIAAKTTEPHPSLPGSLKRMCDFTPCAVDPKGHLMPDLFLNRVCCPCRA